GPSTDKAEGDSRPAPSNSESPSSSSIEQQPSVEHNGEGSTTERSELEVECTEAARPTTDDNDEDLLALLALLSPEPPRPMDEPDDDDFHGLLAALSPSPPTLSPVDGSSVTGIAAHASRTEGLSGDAGPPVLSAERQAGEETAADPSMSGTSQATTLIPASAIDGAACEAVCRNGCASNASCMTAAVTPSTAARGSSPTIETVVPATHINVPSTTPEANAGMTKAVDANTKEARPPTSQYPCYPCGITFPDYTLFQVHLGFHSWSNPFKCNRCGHQATSSLEFNVHLYETKHDERINGSIATPHQESSGALRNKSQSCSSRSSPKKAPVLRLQEQASSSPMYMRPSNGISSLAVPRPPSSETSRHNGVIVSAQQLRAFHCNAAN
ncbi:zinc finger protein, partial [Aphelenchoides avenae]